VSARQIPSARRRECDALAGVLARHAPRGAVRVAEALAAAALNRRRRAERLWNGAFAGAPARFDEFYAGLPAQPIGTRADAAWNRACRRIAARALAGAGPDPTLGAYCVTPLGAPAPGDAPVLTARFGPFAFYRASAHV
jgi:hypothetical protein